MGGASHGFNQCFFELAFKKWSLWKGYKVALQEASPTNETYLHHLQILKFVDFNLQKSLAVNIGA